MPVKSPLLCAVIPHPATPLDSSPPQWTFIQNQNHVQTMLTLGQLVPATAGQNVDEDRDVDVFVFLACLEEFLKKNKEQQTISPDLKKKKRIKKIGEH